jgi:hypothetical protein
MIIKINATEQERKDAKYAHELFTINAILVHIIGTLGLIKLLNISMNVAIGLLLLFLQLSLFILIFAPKKPYKMMRIWFMCIGNYHSIVTKFYFMRMGFIF